MSVIKTLINKIKSLNTNEKIHILTILKKHNIEYTKNYNGYFFNLDKIDEPIINKLNQCIDLIETNRDLIYLLDKKRDDHLKYYKTLIETKLNETINIKINNYIQKLKIKSDESFRPFIKKKTKNLFKKKLFNGKILDPDLLIKEYNSLQKYEKDSVYYRLYQVCKLSARKTKPSFNSSETNYTTNNMGYDEEDNDLICNEDDVDDLDNENADIEGEELLITEGQDNSDLKDSVGDDLSSDPNNGITEDMTTEINNETIISEDLESDIDDAKNSEIYEEEYPEGYPEGCAEEDENTSDNEADAEDRLKIEFYKNLLKTNHGFDFDYDKDVKILYEEYIY